jgi:hypothetical protein
MSDSDDESIESLSTDEEGEQISEDLDDSSEDGEPTLVPTSSSELPSSLLKAFGASSIKPPALTPGLSKPLTMQVPSGGLPKPITMQLQTSSLQKPLPSGGLPKPITMQLQTSSLQKPLPSQAPAKPATKLNILSKNEKPLPPQLRAPISVSTPPPTQVASSIQTISGEKEQPKTPFFPLNPFSASDSGPKPLVSKILDVEAELKKIPGMSIMGITESPGIIKPDINDILKREENETENDFEIRRRLTLKLASSPHFKINNSTAVVVATMMTNKAKLGLVYEENVEAVLDELKKALQQ